MGTIGEGELGSGILLAVVGLDYFSHTLSCSLYNGSNLVLPGQVVTLDGVRFPLNFADDTGGGS